MKTFDLIGAIELTASAAILISLLASALARSGPRRAGAAILYAMWFGAIVLLAARGAFALPVAFGALVLGGAVALPVIAGVALARAWPQFRAAIGRAPLPTLIGIHAVRVLGISFVLLYAADRLPAPFAPVAGWGDVAVGLTALPVLGMVLQHRPNARSAVLIWNTLGLLDLLTAVGLGLTSAANSPLRLFYTVPDTQVMSGLPWILIPAFLVPNLILIHAAIYWRTLPAKLGAHPTLVAPDAQTSPVR